jgi:hypothetical protein
LYVNARKHPAGHKHPIGLRRISTFTVTNDTVTIGAGKTGFGWTIKRAHGLPSFLDIRIGSEKGKKVTLEEAIAYSKS